MAYRLDIDESVPEGMKRIVREEIDSAVSELRGKTQNGRDERIHEARKSVKKIRGALRLLRPELGGIYRAENKRLQEVGRTLSGFRDAGAIVETFDGLTKKYGEEIDTHDLDSIRRELVRRKEESEQQQNIESVLASAASSIRKIGSKVKSWPLETDGFQAIGPGLKQTFRRGRKALAGARTQPTPENYHDLRKRVKDHWYHVRLLEDLWTDVLQGYEKSLDDLQNWLGDDHNLVVLHDTILAQPESFGNGHDVKHALDLIDRYQKEIREKSISLGERVYDEKPAEFVRRMRRLWRAWKEEPKSMEKQNKQDRQAAKKKGVAAEPPTTKKKGVAAEPPAARKKDVAAESRSGKAARRAS